jgi:transposase
MIRTELDDATREQLQALRRRPQPPRVRDRIALVILSDAGWSAPRIAAHLGYCGQAVRDPLRAFLARGADALYPFRTGLGPDVEQRNRVADELRRWLAQDRNRTSRQLARALAGRGIAIGARQVRRHLKRLGARDRRTAATLTPQQDPAKAERAGRILENLEAKAAAGTLILYYLDGCGSSPAPPLGYRWSVPTPRRLVRDEAPQGRRVHALAADRPFGRSPHLEVFTAERTWDSDDRLGFLKALPWSKAPRGVVLDSASIHTGQVSRRARRRLTAAGIYRYFLPPYSPERNQAEPVFRQGKHQEIPQRSFTTRRELREAVVLGFSNYGHTLRSKRRKEVRPAA